MPGHRLSSHFEHNIHFFNSENDELGGAWQTGSLTWDEMRQRMDIVFEIPTTDFTPFPCLEDGNPKDPIHHYGPLINIQEPNNEVIKPGFYILLGRNGEPINIQVNQQMPPPRALTRSHSRSDSAIRLKFRDRVRDRDHRCVITGRKPAFAGDFTALHATHIFPTANLELWEAEGRRRQITDDEVGISDVGINSVQNGILICMSTTEFFIKYMVAINPDLKDGYKVVCFVNDTCYEGLTMFRRPDIPDKYQPCEALLRRHFRMAVLLNMKGRIGYPVWDEDIPEGCDEVAEILDSEQGKLRLETVIAGKLNQSVA